MSDYITVPLIVFDQVCANGVCFPKKTVEAFLSQPGMKERLQSEPTLGELQYPDESWFSNPRMIDETRRAFAAADIHIDSEQNALVANVTFSGPRSQDAERLLSSGQATFGIRANVIKAPNEKVTEIRGFKCFDLIANDPGDNNAR